MRERARSKPPDAELEAAAEETGSCESLESLDRTALGQSSIIARQVRSGMGSKGSGKVLVVELS